MLLFKGKAPPAANRAPVVGPDMAREAERAAAATDPVTPVGAKGVRVGPAAGKEDMAATAGAKAAEAGTAAEPQKAE